MTKNIDDGKHAMIFVFTDCWEVIFWRKKRGKTPIFRIYRPLPYSSRDGENMLSSCPPPVEITPKTSAKIASLNSSIAFGDLRLGGCLRRQPPQTPARAQSPTRNTRIKRRNFRTDFVGYFDVPESEVYTPEFTVRAQERKRKNWMKRKRKTPNRRQLRAYSLAAQRPPVPA